MRMIDADELRAWLVKAGRFLKLQDDKRTASHAIGKIIDHVDKTPAVDAVPVIRCRDCKFWEAYGSKAARNTGDPLERYGGCEIWRGGHLESDFCSYGQAHTNSTPLNQEERWLKTV